MEIYHRTTSRLSPVSKIIVRTIAYSVVLGLPLIFAFICLAVTVAGTWRYVGNPIFVLFGCLTFGLVFMAVLGTVVGGLMAALTVVLYGRVQDPTRYRLLVTLVPLSIVALFILNSLPKDLTWFWFSYTYPFQLRLLDIGGWFLATSIATGISQIVAYKCDNELSKRKREEPAVMWRGIPLLKMVLCIVASSIALSVTVRLLSLLLMPEWWAWASNSELTLIMNAVWAGLSQGLIFGNALAVATMLGFGEISRPRFYQVTMATLALIIVIILRSNFSIHYVPTVLGPRQDLLMSAVTLVHDTLYIGLSTIAATSYCRAVAFPRNKRDDRINKLHAV